MLCKNTVEFDQLTQLKLEIRSFPIIIIRQSGLLGFGQSGVQLVDAEQFTAKKRHLTNQKINSLFLKIPGNSAGP